ncbi:neurocalcin-like [Crassostrea angulata]|uniref:EF-hand domain-containing protein n=1 Tax=Magallana gigas TaxID=29159 RepID=A0A8W8LZ91_MAGGI|nr:neurocalcin-like [Crassostrea gigas]XP_052680453.1 neurocalcin-like [Crassostrea angulata]|eukprot:XP_019920827.1 PREDICTED: neurocalcin-like [Crassostrea gigas]
MGQRQSKLAPRTLAELRNQTNFSVEELQEWYKEFKASWPKGFLTEDEFKGVYSNIFPLGDATEFARHVFRVFDQNKDGLLDFREFMCGFSVVLLGSLEEKLKFSFNIYDIDGNGFISRNEMSAILSALNKGNFSCGLSQDDPEEKTASIFNKMDSDCDDNLSVEEFIEGAKKDPFIVKSLNLD